MYDVPLPRVRVYVIPEKQLGQEKFSFYFLDRGN